MFNPITGQPLDGDDGLVYLNHEVVQVLQLPYADVKFLRGLLLMDREHKVRWRQ